VTIDKRNRKHQLWWVDIFVVTSTISLFALMQVGAMQVGDLHVQEDKLQVSL
jgi:hypothetical protein